MDDPVNWYRGDRGVGPGPAVLFDLDGVISDASHRQSYLRGEVPDWRGFFTAGVDDPVIDTGRGLAAGLGAGHALVILTARPAYMAQPTRRWLAANDIAHDLLVIRPDDDRRRSADYKRDELTRLIDAGYRVELALDDDPLIVAMYRENGVFALYVHSGYYER